MNAPTVRPAPTIPTTASIATAAGAISPTPLRIDTFIKSKLKEAKSADFSGLKSSAEAARSHGFTACANSRYADFLAAMSGAQDQVSYYAEKYPACFFLPWTALNATLTALNLWCDLPKHYTGAIPPGQLPYLDIFSLDPSDTVQARELLQLINDGSLREDIWLGLLTQRTNHIYDSEYPTNDRQYFKTKTRFEFERLPPKTIQTLRRAVDEFQSSWFVIAPPAAFNVTEDWRARTRRLLIDATPKKEPPPNDPLVVRFVQYGCLVVSAWGDEAAELNATVNSINI